MKIDPRPVRHHSVPQIACKLEVEQITGPAYRVRVTIKLPGGTQRLYLSPAEATALKFDIGMALCSPS